MIVDEIFTIYGGVILGIKKRKKVFGYSGIKTAMISRSSTSAAATEPPTVHV